MSVRIQWSLWTQKTLQVRVWSQTFTAPGVEHSLEYNAICVDTSADVFSYEKHGQFWVSDIFVNYSINRDVRSKFHQRLIAKISGSRCKITLYIICHFSDRPFIGATYNRSTNVEQLSQLYTCHFAQPLYSGKEAITRAKWRLSGFASKPHMYVSIFIRIVARPFVLLL